MDFPPKRGAAVATVKVRNIAAIPRVLRDLGADADAVMRAAGVSPALFANLENVMPYAAAARLIARCVAATGADDFGLRVGALSGPSSIGLTGLVSVNSPTVREGIRVIVETLTTVDTGGAAFLDVRDGTALLGYDVTAPDVEAVDQIEDIAVAIGAHIMRGLCGAGFRPTRVRLARKAPRDRTVHARFHRAPVEFEAPRACLEFDAALLDAPVVAYDPDSADVLAPLLEGALASVRPDFLSSARSTVRALVASGALSRDNVCKALRVSARTLSHRLEAHGVSYSSLADEARYEAACGFLLKEKPIAEIASTLGFAEQSGFTRAFKAWSGATPARWRAQRAR